MTYDVTLPSAGSFPDLATANDVTATIVRAHAEELTAFFARSRMGTIRRMRPLRRSFDESVGTVALRSGETLEAHRAVVLVHDVEGGALVFATFPEEELAQAPFAAPALEVLFGAYLHADWPDEHDGPLAAVRLFMAAEDDEVAAAARQQLAQLASWGDEKARREAARAFGSYFVPRPPGQLDRFLAEAAQALR